MKTWTPIYFSKLFLSLFGIVTRFIFEFNFYVKINKTGSDRAQETHASECGI